MACHFRLLVMFVFVFCHSVHGHEACYDDSWTYHSHTYSCFRHFRVSKKWTEARDYCSEIQLGSTYGVITRLAKIDDETTDNFIRTDVFPTRGWLMWIGLYYNTDKNAFRWDGYPDETPRYTAADWRDSTLPYVITYIDGWMGRDNDRTSHFVCQHLAKKIESVTCEQQVQANGLKLTCRSDKSPVRAGCDWTYKYDGDLYFRAWRSIDNFSNVSRTENSGRDISYITTCSVTFSNVNAGTLMFKMKMYPDISGLDVSTREDVHTVGRLNIVVDKPDKPQFKLLDNTLQTSSPILFHNNDRIAILCEVQSGKPSVLSVTLSCEFPFNNSDVDNKHTVSGTTYVMDEIAACNMDGKSCTCTGHHLTGPIESSPLTFSVTYPQPKSSASSSCLSTGTIVGVNLASNVVVIILTILSMIAFRKLRKRNKYKAKHEASGSGRVNAGFHKPEQEAIDAGYVEVPAHAKLPGKDLQAPPKYEPEGSVYEGEELQSLDATMYETIKHTKDEDDRRAKKESYEILHADDPNYKNLNREPLRKYATIGDKSPSCGYESPTPAK